jgi:tetratricopeptide (TPR) repeat protein
MVGLIAKCPECGFDNPRRWVCCARCNQLLGPNSNTGITSRQIVTSVTETFGTRPTPTSELRNPGRRHRSVPALFELDQSSMTFVHQEPATNAITSGINRAFAKGMATLITLEGLRGSGKTRVLVRASEIAAKQYPTVQIWYGGCRGQGDGPYAPFSRILLERFGIKPSSSPQAVRGTMSNIIGNALASEDDQVAAETTHLLGHIAGVPFPDSPHVSDLETRPAEFRLRAAEAMRRFVQGDAQKRPLLMLLDDMERAENEAWELLDSVLDSEGPVAIVIAGREQLLERVEQQLARHGSYSAKIIPLDKAGVEEMVRTLVPEITAIPEPLVAALTLRSRGNPGALKELVRGLLEGGLFSQTQDGLAIDLAKLESGVLPLAIEDVIRARRDNLGEYERTVIERAAVIGEMFWEGALLALERAEAPAPNMASDRPSPEVWPGENDEEYLNRALSLLEQMGFVVEIEHSDLPGLSEYTFQHARTRSVIYEDLPAEVRVRRHAVVARWLKMMPEVRQEGVAGLIAPHLEHAGLTEEAGHAYLQVATEERQRMRTTMALRYIEKALPLIAPEDMLHQIDALHEYGALLTVLGRYQEAEAAFIKMARLAWTTGARAKGGAALNCIARIYQEQGDYAKALSQLQRALPLFSAVDDQKGVASVLDDIAQVHRHQGNLDAAFSAAQGALDIRVHEKDLRGQALSLTTMGYIMLDRGDFSTARSHFDQALALRASIGDYEGAVETQLALGRLAFYQGNIEDAELVFQDALENAREMASHRLQCSILNHLGETWTNLNKLDDAKAALLDAKSLAEKINDRHTLANITCNLGLLALKQGRKLEAEDTLKKALELAREFGNAETIALVNRAIGRLRAQTIFDDGSSIQDGAAEYFHESIRIFTECGNRHELARSLAELGNHLIERGDKRGALEVLSKAHDTMITMELPDRARLKQTLSELL